MKKVIFLLTVICLGLTINVHSQKMTLNSGEFYASVRNADEKRFASSRRETRYEENFTDGKLTSTKTIIDEYIKPNKQHFLSTENANGKIKKLEIIAIGKNYYQREDNGAWTKIKNWYGSGGLMAGSPDEKSEFMVEDDKFNNQNGKIYTALYTYKNDYLDKNGLSYTQIKRWITKDGWVLKEEIIVGVLESKKVVFKRTYNHEYNPKNLKIEAPIK